MISIHPIPSNFRRSVYAAFVLSIASIGLTTLPARAQQPDATIAATEAIISRALTTPRDATVLTHLRSTRDPALLPLFDKVATKTDPTIQVYAMVAGALISKDPARLDIDKLLHCTDGALVGSALASLIDTNSISDAQLLKVAAATETDAAQRVLAATELDKRKGLSDRQLLATFTTDKMKDSVRYYAAVTLLQSQDAAENTLGLNTLSTLLKQNDLHDLPVQGVMLVRIRKDKIIAAVPWVETVARNESTDEGIRSTAVSTLLALEKPSGAEILAAWLGASKETIEQVKLGLIATEFASAFKADQLAPLDKSKSPLVRNIGTLAHKALDGGDFMPTLDRMIVEGQPIVLNWALLFADRLDAPRKLHVRLALLDQAAVVDDQRRDDFERAAVAAQKISEDNTPEGRAALAERLLKSDNPAVAEAIVGGLVRSNLTGVSELVLPAWDRLIKQPAFAPAANYAAVILAREGHAEAAPWLASMVRGGRVDNDGLRAIAGWYYAKLTNQSDAMLQRLIAADPK